MDKCRSCGGNLPDSFLLEYKNMPKSAQFFPTLDNIDIDNGVDILLKQCKYCGLVQAIGKPVPYYRDVIRATGVSDEMYRFRVKQYKKWVLDNGLIGKKVLEIGSGKGEYMSAMECSGANTYGLENLLDSVTYAKSNGHLCIHGFVENELYKIEGAPYDGFYCMNFLEHIPEPGEFLKGIANNLSENASGLVEVPNFDMMLKHSLYSEFIQDHLCYFTKKTLCDLLEKNGFTVLSCNNIWYDYILSAEVKKRTQLDVSCFKDSHDKIKKQMQEFLVEQKTLGNNIAVWGAGHQALANLSLLEMKNYISFVIDSAEFKQNKFTPATHISIVSPDKLKDGDIQMVIIMAAGYSKEVSEIMIRDYPGIDFVIMTEKGIELNLQLEGID